MFSQRGVQIKRGRENTILDKLFKIRGVKTESTNKSTQFSKSIVLKVFGYCYEKKVNALPFEVLWHRNFINDFGYWFLLIS